MKAVEPPRKPLQGAQIWPLTVAAYRALGEAGLIPKNTELLYGFDAHIQDTLAARAFGTASAYQLGRAVAETYWALDPTAPAADPTSWQFLLGPDRRAEIV